MASAKHILAFLTYLQVVAAIAMVALAIYLLVSIYLIGVAAAIVLLILGIALLVFSCFGVIGAHRKSKFCLCLYQIGIIPLMLAALGLGIGASVYSSQLFDNGNNQLVPANQPTCVFSPTETDFNKCSFGNTGKTQQIVQDLYTTTQQALCWFGRLTCSNLKGSPADTCSVLVSQQTLSIYLSSQGLNKINMGDADNNALDCDLSIDNTPNNNNFQAYGAFIQYIEGQNKCSGIGYAVPYYVFSNINNTPLGGLSKNCNSAVQDTISNWLKTAYIISYIVFSFLFVNVVLSLCVCCKKRHHHDKSADVYTRMNYYED